MAGPTTTPTTAALFSGDNDTSNHYAAPITLSRCRCPHLEAILPHILDTTEDSNNLHRLHYISFFGRRPSPDGPEIFPDGIAADTVTAGTTASPVPTVGAKNAEFLFGPEEGRKYGITRQGLSDSYCPLLAPYVIKRNARTKERTKRRRVEDPHRLDHPTTAEPKPPSVSSVDNSNRSSSSPPPPVPLPSESTSKIGSVTEEEDASNQSYRLSKKRFEELFALERTLLKQKEAIQKDRIAQSPSSTTSKKKGRPKSSQQQQPQQVSPKKPQAAVTSAPPNPLNWWEDETKFVNPNDDSIIAAAVVEDWLEVFRCRRESYWRCRRLRGRRETGGNRKSFGGRHEIGGARCGWCRDDDCCLEGDELMQCLECSTIGCGPCSVSPMSRQHLIRHFIKTGHSMGVTCGHRSDLFCMRCGDFVYHEVFQNELLRIDLKHSLPDLGWKQHLIKRSLTVGDFYRTSSSSEGDGGVVLWQGMVATYPTTAKNELVIGGRESLRRLEIMRGCLSSSMDWGPAALSLGLVQSRKTENNYWKIKAPVGLYNMGNTCYMSCILQCLVHCVPLQKHFLGNVAHHYGTCRFLRKHASKPSAEPKVPDMQQVAGGVGKNSLDEINLKQGCLACDLDRLFLEMFGSSISLDVIKAFKESPNPSTYQDFSIIKSTITDDSPSLSNHKNSVTPCNNNTPKQESHHGITASPDHDNSIYGGNTPPVKPSQISSSNGSITSANSTSTTLTAKQQNSQPRAGTPVVPARLLASLWNCKGMKHLAGYEQRDATEFLQAFLDNLSKDLVKHRTLVDEFGGDGGGVKNKERDVVRDIFGGSLRSVLFCKKCGGKRSQPEPFLIVSLPIDDGSKISDARQDNRHSPPSEDKNTATPTETRFASKKISVQSCLERFTTPEALTDPVHCPSCDEKTETFKQHTFAKLPGVLCLHLKRFDARTNKKIIDPVTFPGHGLNMGPHLPHWCEVVQGMQTSEISQHQSSLDNQSSHPQVLYDLMGTVNHTGTLHQGHYVSNVKVNGHWYRCNDAVVTNAGEGIGEKEVLKNEGAYILFYARR